MAANRVICAVSVFTQSSKGRNTYAQEKVFPGLPHDTIFPYAGQETELFLSN